MKCSFCEKELIEKISFATIFKQKSKITLCEECKKHINIHEHTVEGRTLYYFSDYEYIKDLIYDIKYYGALHKAKSFERLFKNFFKLHNFDLITIVPANNIRKCIRTFDQVEQICKICNVKYTKVFYCDYRPKQAKLHKKREDHKFYILEEFLNEYKNNEIKNVLIIDDVFTSGRTLLSCAKELEELYPTAEITFLALSLSGGGIKK